jgi:hypothetical protein
MGKLRAIMVARLHWPNTVVSTLWFWFKRVLSFLLQGPRWAWLQANEWAWFGGLALGGFTVASVNEFGLAAILFFLAAVSCAAHLWSFEAIEVRFLSLWKVLGTVGILVGLVYLLGVDNEFRADRPWSQFPSAIVRSKPYWTFYWEPQETIPQEKMLKDLNPWFREIASSVVYHPYIPPHSSTIPNAPPTPTPQELRERTMVLRGNLQALFNDWKVADDKIMQDQKSINEEQPPGPGYSAARAQHFQSLHWDLAVEYQKRYAKDYREKAVAIRAQIITRIPQVANGGPLYEMDYELFDAPVTYDDIFRLVRTLTSLAHLLAQPTTRQP